MIPITLLTGFLGAGKTSLASHLLREAGGLRIAMLVNDFGSLNIDAALLGGVQDDVVALDNGCICCSLAGGFHAAIARVLKRDVPPECIMVECSGASDPFEVVDILRDPELARFANLDGVLAVVDAAGWDTLDDESRALAERQVRAADLVLLNKIDRAADHQIARVEHALREFTPSARIAPTEQARIPLSLAFGRADTPRSAVLPSAGDAARTRGATDLFETRTIPLDGPVSAERLRDFIGALPPDVYRTKGFVELRERPGVRFVVQATGRSMTLSPWDGPPDPAARDALILIGRAGSLGQIPSGTLIL